MSGLGYICAALSAVFNGSFAAPFKFDSVANVNLDFFWFQLYVSAGVFLSCFLFCALLPVNPGMSDGYTSSFTVVPLAIAAGALFVGSVVFSFAAIPLLGLALAQGVWGGLAILISFVWGVAIFGNQLKSSGVAILSLLLLVVGVAGIAYCQALGDKLLEWHNSNGSDRLSKSRNSVSAIELGRNSGLESAGSDKYALMDDTSDGGDGGGSGGSGARGSLSKGFLAALGVGVFGGSTLAPTHYVAADINGLVILPGFGIGTLLTSLAVTAVWYASRKPGQVPPMHLRTTLGPGLLSGFLWNVSNVLAIYAIPQIGFAVAYPMLQCALFIAGLWGIFVFKEIHSWGIWMFFASGSVLIAGAGLLAVNTGK